jgi:hypothetical protein
MAREFFYCDPDTELSALMTNRDLVDALDDNGDEDTDEDVVLQCLTLACDEIDEAYAMRGIAVPLDITVEVQAPRWCKYLFVAHAFQRRHMPPERSGHGAMIKTVRDILAKIAAGKMDVPSLKGATAVTTTGATGAAVPGVGNAVNVESEEALTVPRVNRILS